MRKHIWITWEKHRRTKELAGAFNATLIPIIYNGSPFIRYPFSLLKTIYILLITRPAILFVQNPSMILATLASALKPIFRYQLIVDRHSNFRFSTINSRSPKWKFFHALSRYTIKKADVTIVTVQSLAALVNDWGGNGLVLQDKIPDIPINEDDIRELKGNFNVVCVSTFVADEPIFDIVNAAALISDDTHIYLTGKYDNFPEIKILQKIKPKNVTFTGFISDYDYAQLLYSADAIMVLTMLDELLTCGAYEAVAINKPMILSNTEALSAYFYKGAAYTGSDKESIARAIIDVQKNYNTYLRDIKSLHDSLDTNWLERFQKTKTVTHSLRDN